MQFSDSPLGQLFIQLLPPGAKPDEIILVLVGASLLTTILTLGLAVALILAHGQKKRLTRRLRSYETERQRMQQKVNRQEIRAAKLITILKNERRNGAEKLRLLEEAREELQLQFSHLAQRIFDEKSERFSELNHQKLSTVIEPFNAQLTALKQEINEIYRNDSRERFSLKAEIVQLRDLNQQVTQEAANLTRALKGDRKVQGNWGEMVLERILERSGLRPGHEYETQSGFRDPQNRLKKPDVIVHMPQGNDVVIDSKVSLVSWERYINSDTEGEKQRHLEGLVQAVRNHIISLGSKDYPSLHGIRSLDFVLMFMPVETAFHVAIESDPALLDEALKRNIVVVTPATLLAALRTIDNLWQFEQQSRNALEIARRASLLYDKFHSFVEELEKIGKQLATCHSSYDNALNKLTRGRGNLIAQAEHLRTLGVQVKKEIPKSIREMADLDLLN